MKRKILYIILLLSFSIVVIKAEKIDYYFEPDIIFDSRIPSPEEFLGYEIGSRVTEHSLINAYFEKLDELSDRTSLIEIGRTHEKRKIYVLVVSSPSNINNLESIKQSRQQIRQGKRVDSPLIIFLGNAVHGNESSSAEAAMLSAYYYVAGQSEKVRKHLEDGIYFIDPVRNPDGLERFASWINSNSSLNYFNLSSLDREHVENWPRGRGNHYWFDLNRDWINIVHPESKARVAFYQDWLPHVQGDHHEMGTNSTFFFEPTDPDGNESRFVPQLNYKLNRIFADYFAKALDKIGSFYYTKESYDNKNPNFGSTYPDYNGGLGILFEQGSSRGLKQESENGTVEYAFTIRNQLVTAIATVDAANENKSSLVDLQDEFFTPNKRNAPSYIIGDSYDLTRLHNFIRLLLSHRLEVYENNNDVTVNNIKYEKRKSYIIPSNQPNSALIGIIFDNKTDYTEEEAPKLGYGAGFSIAHSTGLTYDVSNAARGNKTTSLPNIRSVSLIQSEYAYVVDFRDSKSQQLVFRLLEKDILVKTASKSFSLNLDGEIQDFSVGSLLVPVRNQTLSSSELYAILKDLSVNEDINIYPVYSGLSEKGIDLGSSAFRTIERPRVLLVTGNETSSTEAGEVWYLFDQKLKYPVVRVDSHVFSRVDLNRFNNIVFVSGDYPFINKQGLEDLRNWIRNGGTLITVNGASRWAISNKLISARQPEISGKEGEKSQAQEESRQTRRSSERVPTSVFQTTIDLEHPLASGLTNEFLPVIRENGITIDTLSVSTVVSKYTDSPLLNGYISPGQLETLKGTVSVGVSPLGRGSVVFFAENPVFRGIWDATSRTFVNAILFKNNEPGYY